MTDELRQRRIDKVERCAKRGHDWEPDEDGQHCTRCPIRVNKAPAE